MSKREVPTFSIKELFTDSSNYIIPIYQRNYAWGEKEISQLIQDIYDYQSDENKKIANYYIGTLVVFERNLNNEIIYETIDGQQRLTSLNILINALHRVFDNVIQSKIDYSLNLKFDSRKKSTDTLGAISGSLAEVIYNNTREYNANIQNAYKITEKSIKKIIPKNEADDFYQYLVNKVRVVRVSVPEETDLNHYFEIMNNRGEQLEKHEILKAKLLEELKDKQNLSFAFNKIWEATSDMERYIQYGFSIDERNGIFGEKDWNQLICQTLDDVSKSIIDAQNSEKMNVNSLLGKKMKLSVIATSNQDFGINNDHIEDAPERFNSVINFSNFLLHVLRIQTQKDISLDDKRLIELFDEQLKDETIDNLEFVKQFGVNLLKLKHIFDQFIIKREFIREKGQWSLKRLKWYDKNRVSYVNTFGDENDEGGLNKEILMLLSMFHVSAPTLVYKHWLNASLNYIFNNPTFIAEDFRNYLLELAKSFFFDRYISKGEPIPYFDIIYKNKGLSINSKSENYDFNLLDVGTEVENFVFNYLDFILWKESVDGYNNFEFTFRSSVEHYYPQNPISKEYAIDKNIYDLFGNLCLISSSKNSRLSNHMPEAKKDYYDRVGIDSLKQKLMMDYVIWEEEEIRNETKEMKNKLYNFNHD